MPDAAKSPLADFLTRFVDVANLSKIVTDVGPGFLIAFSLILLFSFFTDIAILPIQRYERIQSQIDETKNQIGRIEQETSKLRKDRIHREATKKGLEVTPTKPENSVQTETEKKKLEEEIKNSVVEEAERKTKLEELRKRLAELQTQHDDSGSLVANLELLERNTISVLFLALILGVIFSQASGQTFYNDIYRRRFQSSAELQRIPAALKTFVTGEDGTPNDISYFRGRSVYTDERKKEYESLIKEYYRYAEVAMNMVAPVGLLVLALFLLTAKKILDGQRVYWIALILVLLGGFVVVQLARGGYDFYKNYRIKIAAFIKGLWEEEHAQKNKP